MNGFEEIDLTAERASRVMGRGSTTRNVHGPEENSRTQLEQPFKR